MRTLIKNVTILTMNEHFDVIEDGQMLIDDENIIEIGKTCVQKYDQYPYASRNDSFSWTR